MYSYYIYIRNKRPDGILERSFIDENMEKVDECTIGGRCNYGGQHSVG
jgi:hypothetical protein